MYKKTIFQILLIIFLCSTSAGCVSKHVVDLERFQTMDVKMTSENGLQEASCGKEWVDALHSTLNQSELKEAKADSENGWHILCTLHDGDQNSIVISIRDDRITIDQKSYQISDSGDQQKIYDLFESIFR